MGSIYKRDVKGLAGKPAEKCWTIEWRGHDGRPRRRRVKGDRIIAVQLLAREEARVLRGEAGLLDPFESTKRVTLASLLESYRKSLTGGKRASRYVRSVGDRLALAFSVMGVRNLQDVSIEKCSTFLDRLLAGDGMPAMKPRVKGGSPIPRGPVSAKTRDRYAEAMRAFGAWLVATDRWPLNPFTKLRGIAGDDDRTMEHRAFTPDEIGKLIEAATVRAVQQWAERYPHSARLQETLDELRAEGWRRSVLYEFSAYAGLRLSECATLTWADVVLDGPEPCVTVKAANSKNRKRGQSVPLVPWVVNGLVELHKRDKADALRAGKPMVGQSDRVFGFINRGLLEQLRQDARWAELGDHDAQGRTTTFHGFRASTCTMLHRAGVALAVAVRIMRHADPKLTIETYAKLEALTDGHRELLKMSVPKVTAVPTVLPGALAGVNVRPKVAGAGRSDFAGIDEIPSQVVASGDSRPGLAESGRSANWWALQESNPALTAGQPHSGAGSPENAAAGSPSGSSARGLVHLRQLMMAVRGLLTCVNPPPLPAGLREAMRRLLEASSSLLCALATVALAASGGAEPKSECRDIPTLASSSCACTAPAPRTTIAVRADQSGAGFFSALRAA
jgi:integrase